MKYDDTMLSDFDYVVVEYANEHLKDLENFDLEYQWEKNPLIS